MAKQESGKQAEQAKQNCIDDTVMEAVMPGTIQPPGMPVTEQGSDNDKNQHNQHLSDPIIDGLIMADPVERHDQALSPNPGNE